MKTCSLCGEIFPITAEFFVRKRGSFSARCKPCLQSIKRAEWSKRAVEINAVRRSKRDDGTRDRERARYRADPAQKRASVSAWRAANPDKARAIDRQQYEKNSARRKRQAAEWAAANPEARKRAGREFHRRRREADPGYRLRAATSALIYWHLKSGKGGRRTEDLLGYTIAKLKDHLQRQFLEGMSWANYGEWHVDHILPIAGFEFTSPDDDGFRACWALTNLRPLWAADNVRKSDERLHLI